MAQPALETLLSSLVESSIPAAQALDLIHLPKLAPAFGVSRRTVERQFLGSAVHLGGRTYVQKQSILKWWKHRQARPCRTRLSRKVSR
jgi:hypothetical protein